MFLRSNLRLHMQNTISHLTKEINKVVYQVNLKNIFEFKKKNLTKIQTMKQQNLTKEKKEEGEEACVQRIKK